jgi:hypothetical protein
LPFENFLVDEFPEDMLMDGDENAAGEADEAQDQNDNDQNDFGLPPDNIQLGFVEIANNFDTDPGLENFLASKEMPFLPKQNAEAVRLWAKHFNVPNQSAVKIPFECSNFYTTLLLSPTHFSWASTLLLSKAWDFFASDKGNVLFAIPPKCPSEVELFCPQEVQAAMADRKGKAVIEDLTPSSSPTFYTEQVKGECSTVKKRKKQNKEEILVDTSVRRSLRVKKANNGFKSKSCVDKNCLACDNEPPAISPSIIRN